jgi:menaquinone-dependent protoporphyrinogen oxidase
MPAKGVKDIVDYDAFVVGGATYAWHWLKDVAKFVRNNKTILASQPTWLFSSGPLGTDAVDPKTGKDVRASAAPKEFTEFAHDINPRDERVFYGAWDPSYPPVGVMEHVMGWTPARKALPEGDFRDWADIDGWAVGIARELKAIDARSPAAALLH